MVCRWLVLVLRLGSGGDPGPAASRARGGKVGVWVRQKEGAARASPWRGAPGDGGGAVGVVLVGRAGGLGLDWVNRALLEADIAGDARRADQIAGRARPAAADIETADGA